MEGLTFSVCTSMESTQKKDGGHKAELLKVMAGVGQCTCVQALLSSTTNLTELQWWLGRSRWVAKHCCEDVRWLGRARTWGGCGGYGASVSCAFCDLCMILTSFEKLSLQFVTSVCNFWIWCSNIIIIFSFLHMGIITAMKRYLMYVSANFQYKWHWLEYMVN